MSAAVMAVCGIAPLEAAVKVGNTELIVKKVTGELAQKQRLLALKDEVFQNELIAAATASASRIVFLDGTELSVGPNTEIVLDRFVFDPDEGSVTFELNVIEGVFRFISGRFANAFKSNYKVKTPTATLGMRGTVVAVAVASDGTTATMLESPSIVTVQGLSGEIVTLDIAGISATSMPDGSVSPPGPAPDWAREAVRQMDMLLANAFDVDTLDHEAPPSETAAPPDVSPPAPPAAEVSPPAPPAPNVNPPAPPAPDVNPPAPPAPDVDPPAPPAPEPALQGRGLTRAMSVANVNATTGGLGHSVSIADTNAEGTVDHGRGGGPAAAGEGAAADGPSGDAGAAGGPNGNAGAADGPNGDAGAAGGPNGNAGAADGPNGNAGAADGPNGSAGAADGPGSGPGANNGGGRGGGNGGGQGGGVGADGTGGGHGGGRGSGRGNGNAGGRGGGVGAANAGGPGGNGNGNGSSK